jgi:serine/threonine protein phosphatase 1
MPPIRKAPRIPEGLRLYVVGDIHGRADLLHQMLEMIRKDEELKPAPAAELFFLGDYIDRGLDSRGVIESLLHALPLSMRAVFLRGNHDDAMLRFLDGELDLAQGWLLLGGTATLASYGLNPFQANAGRDLGKLRDDLAAKVPPEHLAFLKATEFSATRGDYYFVHAGVRPGVPLEAQTSEDQLWIRHAFLASNEDHGKVVVHGHTVEDKPLLLWNRIGIDTGAFATGRLTCLILEGASQRILQT